MKFNRQKEKERAAFAKRLYRWRSETGRKLSMDRHGVAKHKAMVKEYEKLYGKSSPDTLQMYENVYASILGSRPKKIIKQKKSLYKLKSDLRYAKATLNRYQRGVAEWQKILNHKREGLRYYTEKVAEKKDKLMMQKKLVEGLEKEIDSF